MYPCGRRSPTRFMAITDLPEEGVLELAGDLVADRVLDEVAGHAGVEAHVVTRGCLEVAGF